MLPGTEALLRSLLARGPDILLRDAAQAVARTQPAQPLAPVANDPRLPSRAALERQVPSRAAAKQARELSAPALAPASSAGGVPLSAAPASLSAGARALAALLAPAPAPASAQEPAPEPPPVRGAAPLWQRPQAPAAAELAHALGRTVEDSGLFYESHLEQFARGTRTVAQLRREPQAGVAATPGQADAPAAPVEPPQPAAAQSAAHVPGPAAEAPVVHPATAGIVQQQLELLASGMFRWAGEPWAGAHMEWELGAETGAADEPPQGRAWSTRLQVTLPALGTVEASVQLEADGVLRVRLSAEEAAALRQLQDARGALVQRFAAAGLSLAACRVEAP